MITVTYITSITVLLYKWPDCNIQGGNHFPQASKEICSPCVLCVRDWCIDETYYSL